MKKPKTDYAEKARLARLAVLNMIYKAQTSHIGSNFSCIDILTVLFEKANLKEDKIIFSKGWVAASAYYFLATKGVIPTKDLDRFCMPGEERYIGLVEPTIPGIDFAGGSMCMGLAAGVGFALAKSLKNEPGTIYVLESDGGMQGGITWEALQIASHHKLKNLVLIIDSNGFQAMGRTKDILGTEDMANRLFNFGWYVDEIDGHDFNDIEGALDSKPRPLAIIASTVKGKGVSFMEGQNVYHYKAPSTVEYSDAFRELNP